MTFARNAGILCQGRGSAANSVVCYCLGITEVSPEVCGLLFERFISAERGEPPDIDVDFEHERREEVMQYIYNKYGRHRTGLAATVITYRSRSAIREVGKVFGLSDDVVGALNGTMWGWSAGAVPDKEVRRAGLDPHEATMRRVLDLAAEIAGFPRHLSQHVGGFVMTRDRLDEMVPIINAAMEDRTNVEWDKDDLNALGILKVDILALGMLSCIRRAFDFLRAHYGGAPTLASIQDEDPAVYRMLQRADSVGVFQVESRAQMSMLPRLKPKEFYDLVIEVAIVRPGPIQGGMVHPYLRRRQGLEPTVFPSKELEEVLGKTMGVPLFQEQAMKIAIIAAGFKPGEADALRRAMATFKRVGTIGNFKTRFIDGMVAKNYDREFAERCFRQIEGFGDYGFPESHAASFALLVYASAWLKCHYPDVFCAALLNAQPMGFYAPAQIVRDAERHGVTVLPPDVNLSDWDSKLEALPERHPIGRAPTSPVGRGLPSLASPDLIRGSLAERRVRGYGPSVREADAWSRQDPSIPTTPPWPATSAPATPSASASARSRGSARKTPTPSWTTAAPATIRSATCGCAPACRAPSIERLADGDAFRSLGLDRRDALWAARGEGAVKREGPPAPLRHARDRRRPQRARFRPAADADRRAHRQRLPLPQSVAEGAPAVVPARAARRPPHRPRRRAPRHPQQPARHRRRPRHHPPAPGHRLRRHLHDAGGRDRHRQRHRLAQGLRALPPGRPRRAAGRRHRQGAERERRHPRHHRQDRGPDADARRPVGGCRRPLLARPRR